MTILRTPDCDEEDLTREELKEWFGEIVVSCLENGMTAAELHALLDSTAAICADVDTELGTIRGPSMRVN